MLSDRLLALIRNPETPSYVLRDAVMEEERPVPNVYVVMGSTGEYSDYSTWYVSAYLDETHAEAACQKLTDWCKDKGCARRRQGDPHHVDRQRSCPLDPNFSCDYTGTAYEVVTIPLSCAE